MEQTYLSRAERAQIAMMLEVCAHPKPGNVDRCHDYESTWLEHFLASVIFSRSALEKAESRKTGIGALILEASILTSRHCGGNTHFGAFILLIPLIMGGTIKNATSCVRKTTVQDAIAFYQAFAHLEVRVYETNEEFDIHDPAVLENLSRNNVTLYDVMRYSAPHDMVAREWTTGFSLTRKAADLLFRFDGCRDAISQAFIHLLSTEPDTFIAKKFGTLAAEKTRELACRVLAGEMTAEELDQHCIDSGINPGSLADIMIAGIYIAIGEGWSWDV